MNQSDMYQQMNDLMNERNEIFRKREQELKAFQVELQGKEAELYESKRLLEHERKLIEESREQLRQERKEIGNKWKELEEYKKNLTEDMQQILKEKLELQALNNERLRRESERERQEREQMRSQLGLSVKNSTDMITGTRKAEPGAETTQEHLQELIEQENLAKDKAPEEVKELKSEKKPEQGKEPDEVNIPEPEREPEVIKVEETSVELPQESPTMETTVGTEKISNSMQLFMNAAKSIFSEGRVLDISEEMFCLEVEDKELRILKGNPSKAMILARREKSISLKAGIRKLNDMQNEWKFSYEDNYLRCMMPFTEATPAEVVLQSCADAMKQYFK